jgi:hypothetical protein
MAVNNFYSLAFLQTRKLLPVQGQSGPALRWLRSLCTVLLVAERSAEICMAPTAEDQPIPAGDHSQTCFPLVVLNLPAG